MILFKMINQGYKITVLQVLQSCHYFGNNTVLVVNVAYMGSEERASHNQSAVQKMHMHRQCRGHF